MNFILFLVPVIVAATAIRQKFTTNSSSLIYLNERSLQVLTFTQVDVNYNLVLHNRIILSFIVCFNDGSVKPTTIFPFHYTDIFTTYL